MSDAQFQPIDYLMAHDVVRSMGENLAIHFQVNADKMDYVKAKDHFNRRQAILLVQRMLLDEGERIMTP
jgi:hypothetical protein